MPRQRREGSRLQHRIPRMAFLLVLVSLLLSFSLYYTVCLALIGERSDELDQMFLQTAAERTNRYLGEIAEIVNMAATDPNLEVLLSAEPGVPPDYRLVSAQNEYESYLRSLILNYEQAENVLLLYGDRYFVVHESGNFSYKTQMVKFYEQTAPLMQDGGMSQFYLLNLEGGRRNSVAVLTPVFRQGQEGPAGCIAVVLSENFTSQLRFAGEEVFLIDQLGSCFYLLGGEMSAPEEDWIVYDLRFGGWKLAAPSFGENIRADFLTNTCFFLPLGAGYLLLSTLFACLFSQRLLAPVQEMNRSLKRLSARREAGGHSRYRVQSKHRRMHFRKRLLLFYTVLVMIPVIASSACFYAATQRTVDEKIGYFSEHQANFLFDQIRLTLERYQRTAVELAYNSEVQQYLEGAGQRAEQETAVSRFLLQKQTQVQEIMNIALFSPERELLYSSFYSRHFIDRDSYDSLFRRMDQYAYQTCWSGIEPSEFNKNRIPLALTVFSMPPSEDAGRKLGYLFLDFDAAELESLAADFQKQSDTRLYLFGEDGELLLGEWNSAQTETPPDRAGAVSSLENVRFAERFEDSGWTAVAEIPREEYRRERMSILLTCGAIILLLGFLCFMASYFSSAALSRNLEALVQFVKRIGSTGAVERFPSPQSMKGDEIEELGHSFNEMLDTLDQLVERQLESERRYRSSQLAAKQFELNLLQSQINPHFLYNTLKTVQYMVHVQDPRAERMVKLLIHLFRTGISKNERLVTVEEELSHVETYLEIQKIRFSDKFEITVEADEDVRHLYLLKLSLQPIVENAIYHGLELLDRKGHLSIRAEAAEGSLQVTVEDDGNGMSPEKLASVRERLADYQKSKSIGLFNVHERMRLYFGESYGIILESALRAGTRVTLRFPLIEDPGSFSLEQAK